MPRSPAKQRGDPQNGPAEARAVSWTEWGVGMAVFTGACILTIAYADSRAWYYGSAPVFSASGEFLQPLLTIPGGLLAFGAAGVGQLTWHPWLGAFSLLSILILLFASSAAPAADEPAAGLGPLRAIPALAVLYAFARYAPGAFELGLGLLLVQASLLVNKASLRSSRKLALFGVLAAALFYVAGPAASLLFIAAGYLCRMLSKGNAAEKVCCWISLVLWILAVWACGKIDPAGLFERLSTRAVVIAGGIAAVWLFAAASGLAERGLVALRSKLHMNDQPRWVVELASSALAVTLFCFSLNPNERALLRIQSEAERENWPAVLSAAAGLRSWPISARLQVNRALFHEDRLTRDLFAFPQTIGTDLLASLANGLDVCLPLSDTLMELGHVNLAEHYVHEALELRGERPEILWRLAWINLVKERPQAARVFLNRLARAPFQGPRAQRWLNAIDVDPTLAGEPSVLQARQKRVAIDSVERRFATQELLWQAVRSNRQDPMPVQYLTAHFLLTRQPEEIARNLGLLTQSAGGVLPGLLSEGLLALSTSASVPQDFRRWPIDPDAATRFKQFREALTRQSTQDGAAEAAMAREFGSSYWFYDTFGRSAAWAKLRKEGAR